MSETTQNKKDPVELTAHIPKPMSSRAIRLEEKQRLQYLRGYEGALFLLEYYMENSDLTPEEIFFKMKEYRDIKLGLWAVSSTSKKIAPPALKQIELLSLEENREIANPVAEE